jgi:hypothetical protein
MFSWLKKKTADVTHARADIARAAAMDTQSFMNQIKGALGGMPGKMLEDPFIIGTIAAHSAITSKLITNGQCPSAVTESAMVLAVQLTSLSAATTREDALGALFQFKNHPEYARASQAVTLVLAAKHGRRDLAADPVLLEAHRKLKGMPRAFRESFGATDAEQAASLLTLDLLVGPLKAAYGNLWANGTLSDR